MVTDVLDADAVSAYLEAVGWLEDLIASEQVGAAWSLPSSLAHYSTGGVAAHAVYAGVLRLVQMLEEAEPHVSSLVSVAEYYGANRLDPTGVEDPLFVILREGAEKVARQGHERLLSTCRAAHAELRRALPLESASRRIAVARVPGGSSTLADYLRTRVVEIVVHGDDVVTSVKGLVSVPPRRALDDCLALCLELARSRVGDLGVLRAFTRAERSEPEALRVL
ncbi:MAG TPA: maleylpyruvate isomerase N-terminal domain-containing protein [Acidimicrobiales bacterium]|nr:maleylpyruvate isomerase N-terminal domain-containing protein [Acidimicrobiales bacterium]